MPDGRSEARRGIPAIVAACAIWGFAPLLHHPIAEVPALELMAHRTVWTGVMFGALILARGRKRDLVRLLAGPDRGRVLASGLLIGFNRGLFIRAVNADHEVEASLGYDILPLVSAALGLVILGERLGPWQIAGLALIWVAIAFYSVGAWAARGAPTKGRAARATSSAATSGSRR
jgi:chloramphenicol-sensitive protein RarD